MTAQPISGIRELAERAKKMGAIDLAQGVIDTNPPTVLTGTLRQLPLETYSRYNNKRGVPEYREAVQKYLRSRSWPVSLENILATSGATGALTSSLLTHCRPGATVLLPEPFFIGHRITLESLGFNIEYFPTPLGSQPDWEQLIERMNQVQAVVLTTPANPTGQFVPEDVLVRLTKTAKEKDCLLFLDEMYREFFWSHSFQNDSVYANIDHSHTVITRSFSKTFAVPGWRVAFAITTPERVEQMATVHDSLYLGGSTIAQHTLAEALANHLDELNQYVADLRTLLLENKERLETAFRAYGMEPLPVPATYYMLMKHNRDSDMAAIEELITKKIVATPANILFADTTKDTGYIRIHFGITRANCDTVVRMLQN